MRGSLVVAIAVVLLGVPGAVHATEASPHFASASGEAQPLAQYLSVPLHFEPNLGQTEAGVSFVSRGHGYTALFESTGAVELRANSGGSGRGSIRFVLKDSRTPVASLVTPLPGRSHYYLGSNKSQWWENVPQYRRLSFTGVYPGVDLDYYGNQTELEFDFVLAPGSDPGRIRFLVQGANSVDVSNDGELVIGTAEGELRQRPPVIYQDGPEGRVAVDGRFVVYGGREFGFHVGPYDTAATLTIDPVLYYSTFMGGSAVDSANAIALATDGSGAVFVAGQTASSASFPVTGISPIYQGGTSDAFVSKLDAEGKTLLYSTFYGGELADVALAVGVDSLGRASIAGRTDSTLLPLLGAFFKGNDAGTDGFVARLNSDGSLNYSTYVGGNGTDIANALAVDSTDNVYVAGQTDSTTGFPVLNAYQPARSNVTDAFLTVIDPSLTGPAGASLLYSTYVGGSSQDAGLGVAVDSGGVAYITGRTNSANFPTAGPAAALPFDSTLNGGLFGDVFITKIDPAVSGALGLLYSSYVGGTGSDIGYGVSLDSSGNAYVTGETASPDFPMSASPFDGSYAAAKDGFVAVVDTTAGASGLLYSTYLGGAGDDVGRRLAVLGSVAYVAGETNSADFPTTTNAFQIAKAGANADAFVSKVDTTLGGAASLGYSSYLGGETLDQAFDIAVDSGGVAYVAGQTLSVGFPNTVQGRGTPLQGTKAASNDAFVTKISDINPAMSIFIPQVGTRWGRGSIQQIKWTHNLGKYTKVKLYLSEDHGPFTAIPGAGAVSNQFNALSGNFNSAYYSWTVNTLATTGTIRAEWTANGNVFADSVDFAIDPPAITGFSPISPQTWQVGTEQTIAWSDNLGIPDDMVSLGIAQDAPNYNLCKRITSVKEITPDGTKIFKWTVGVEGSASVSTGPSKMCIRWPATAAVNWVFNSLSATERQTAVVTIVP